MSRLTQLDALRAIAVSLVVLHHWTDLGRTIGGGLGNIGVQLFFVLSGFLITRILLAMCDRYVTGETPLKTLLTSFHLSRIIRIWPVAFLTLALVAAAGNRFEQQTDMGWHALFASNVLFFLRGSFNSSLSHFWSLAVEQQFYLFWPFIILLAPRVHLERIIFGFIALAPVTRFALHASGMVNFAQFNVLPFANLDSLGMGALLAVWSGMTGPRTAERWHLLGVAAAISVGGLVALQIAAASIGAVWPANPEQTFYAVAFAWLIAEAKKGIQGTTGRILSWRPLVWLGTISYGVYVFHMFAPRIVGAGLRALDAPATFHSGLPLFAASAVLTLTFANLSWFLMERPLLQLRKSWTRKRDPWPHTQPRGNARPGSTDR